MGFFFLKQGTYNDLFTAANDLLALEGLALTGPLGLKGNLAPDYLDLSDNAMAADSQICELVSAEYGGVAVLTLKDLTGLTGPVPACLFENTSLSTLFIGEVSCCQRMPDCLLPACICVYFYACLQVCATVQNLDSRQCCQCAGVFLMCWHGPWKVWNHLEEPSSAGLVVLGGKMSPTS